MCVGEHSHLPTRPHPPTPTSTPNHCHQLRPPHLNPLASPMALSHSLPAACLSLVTDCSCDLRCSICSTALSRDPRSSDAAAL